MKSIKKIIKVIFFYFLINKENQKFIGMHLQTYTNVG
jgi:hypothetical protein